MKSRRKSRELSLQTLYAAEANESTDIEAIFGNIREGLELSGEALEYALELAKKTGEKRDEIDEQLRQHTDNWDLRRMAAIDRNILRMAIAELKFFSDVPFKVVIDEAVEIAKIYGSDESGKFVNGILDSVYKEILKTKT